MFYLCFRSRYDHRLQFLHESWLSLQELSAYELSCMQPVSVKGKPQLEFHQFSVNWFKIQTDCSTQIIKTYVSSCFLRNLFVSFELIWIFLFFVCSADPFFFASSSFSSFPYRPFFSSVVYLPGYWHIVKTDSSTRVENFWEFFTREKLLCLHHLHVTNKLSHRIVFSFLFSLNLNLIWVHLSKLLIEKLRTVRPMMLLNLKLTPARLAIIIATCVTILSFAFIPLSKNQMFSDLFGLSPGIGLSFFPWILW